jgi:hypothetical protein
VPDRIGVIRDQVSERWCVFLESGDVVRFPNEDEALRFARRRAWGPVEETRRPRRKTARRDASA